jgi:TolB-like protein/tetratricopeptide (TPR) repeat protein
VNDSTKAVFLSYASQDAAAVQRISESLRAAGIEVWCDQNELRGGDAWDREIKKHIRDCALFIPVISRTTQSRLEGYFRREWKFAVDRTLDMADGKPFLIPIVIDDTSDHDAEVPDAFRAVQWSRLTEGEAPAKFAALIARLLATERISATTRNTDSVETQISSSGAAKSRSVTLVLLAALILGSGAAVWYLRASHGSQTAAVGVAVKPAPPAAQVFSPPPHSVAVLPFLNLSGGAKDDYFADGLSEELLNSLASVIELQVAARTSAFSFKGKQVDIQEIARKLNVGAILEGSIRKEGEHVRITAQLIDATSGFHLWSKTYDRDLKSVLKLESEVAREVSTALRATLLASTASTEMSTNNPQAFDAYLKGETLLRGPYDHKTNAAAQVEFSRAIQLDPGFANAYLGKAMTSLLLAGDESGPEAIAARGAAKAAAEQAIKLAPNSGYPHSMLGTILSDSLLNFGAARAEFELGLKLSPGDARVYSASAAYLALSGHPEEAVPRARKAVLLDPLNTVAHGLLGEVLLWSRQYREAAESFTRALQINSAVTLAAGERGYAYLLMGEFQAALDSCTPPMDYTQYTCRAIAYDKLGRRSDADAAIAEMMKQNGDSASYQYAEVFAQRGDIPQALDWLETADRVGDTGLHYMLADSFVDSLRNEPRFKALQAKLNFP